MNRTFGCTLCIVMSSIACTHSSEEMQLRRWGPPSVRSDEHGPAVGAAARVEARPAPAERREEVDVRGDDLAVANRVVAPTTSELCAGLAAPDECPLPDAVIRNSETTGETGTTLTLTNAAGTRNDVERRIACYRARTSLRVAPVEGACIADLTDAKVTVDVQDRLGAVVVVFSSSVPGWSTRFRAEARRVVMRLRPAASLAPIVRP